MHFLSGGCQGLRFAYFSKEATISMMFMIMALKMIVIPSKNDPMIRSPRILRGSSWDSLNDEKRQYAIILLPDISFLL